MPTYSPADFEGSPFQYGQKIRIHLYDHTGNLLGSITGELAAREPNVNVARREDDPPVYKTLYWVRNLEGYQRPHPELPGQFERVEESWFAEQDLQPLEVPPGLSFN